MKRREASNPDIDFRSWVPARVIPGTVYELMQAPIGEGGYGLIYKVRHLETGRVCALKALHRDLAQREDVLQRLRQEVRTIATILPHPNLVDIYDAGYTSDGRFFYVMELLEGRNLRRAISKGDPLDVAEACRVIRQVLSALDKAHRHGIVHRDIKPDNIFLVGDAKARADLVKLLDFGVAKVFGSSTVHTAPGSVVGTYHYFAPENIQGAPITVQTDIYALGVTFWEALTGEHPFPHESQFATLSAIVHDGVPPLAALPRMAERIPPDVCELVQRATATSPDKRFHSAAAFLDAVDDALEDMPPPRTATPASRRTGTPAPARREAPDDPGPSTTDREVVTPWHQKVTKDEAARPKRKKRPPRPSYTRVHDVETRTMLPGTLQYTGQPASVESSSPPPRSPEARRAMLRRVLASVAIGLALGSAILYVSVRRQLVAEPVTREIVPSAEPSRSAVLVPVATTAPPPLPAPAPVLPPPAEAVATVIAPPEAAPMPAPRRKKKPAGPSPAELARLEEERHDQAMKRFILRQKLGLPEEDPAPAPVLDPYKPEPKRGGKK